MDKEDVVHSYNGILLSQKRNKIMLMKFKITILSKVSQTEKDKYHITSLIYGI